MVIAEIHGNSAGLWTGRLRDSETGQPMSGIWQARSRSELIAEIKRWTPLSHLLFRDRMDPLDP